VLFRVETDYHDGRVPVLVQSREAPRWAFETPAVREVEGPRILDALEARIVPGARFRFRLRANPTRRVHHRATLGPDTRELTATGEWKERAEIPEHLRTGIVRRERAEDGRWWREREDGKRIGKRVELTSEEERIAWLRRRGKEHDGFALIDVRLSGPGEGAGGPRPPVPATRADPADRLRSFDHKLTFATALFEGVLEVTDAAALRGALAAGIGPGRAFGCGLLSLAPLNAP